MPRVKTAGPLFAAVARVLKGYGSTTEIAAAMEKSVPTATARIKRPEDLTLGELRRLSMRLHIPKEEIVNSIKW